MITEQYTRPNVSLNLSLNLWNNQTENNPVTSLCNIWQLWTQHFSQDLSLIENKRDRDNKRQVRFRCTFEAFYLHLFFKCFVCSHYEQICMSVVSCSPPSHLCSTPGTFRDYGFVSVFTIRWVLCYGYLPQKDIEKKCVCVCVYSILMI